MVDSRKAFKYQQINHAYSKQFLCNLKRALIKLLHKCLFSPPNTTLIKACEDNQFTTWPGLTADAVKNNYPGHSPVTDKGHMKYQRQGLRSTK